MKKIIPFCLLVAVVVSCDLEEVTSTMSNTNFITGSAEFTNPISGIKTDRPENVLFTIRRKDNMPLPDSFKDSVNGFEFKFGPLPLQTFIVRGEFTDHANKIKYEAETPVVLSGETPTRTENKLILQPDASSGNAIVTINYIDIFTNKIITDQASTKSILRKKDGQSFEGSSTLSNSGASFIASQLSTSDDYIIESTYEDVSIEAKYFCSTEFKITATNTLKAINVDLSWVKTPTVILTLVDKNDAPVEGAQIFTYTNYDFLKQYKDNADASIREATTNTKGQVIFTNLNNVKYYFYGVKSIGSDKYSSFDPAFNSETATSLLTDINRITIKIQ